MKAIKSSSKRTLTSSLTGSSERKDARTETKNRARVVSPPTTVELRGVPIHFPFQPYDCQKDYMETVLDALFRSENALLESPTGTGKTLCLLCACLAWQREEARKLFLNHPTSKSGAPRRVPTIIYASRTHSQLSQVVRELRNTRYRPRHAVLGSREQMCVNPKVKRAGSTGSDINHDCSRLGQERKCNFRNRLDGFSAPGETASGFGVQPVKDMEDLVLMGQKHRVCPFYFTRSLVEDAELILVPYNYLFDRDSRSSTLADVPWKNAVVIFDEAHNLESFASESASFDLTNLDIAGCVAEIQRAINFIQRFSTEESSRVKPENIAKLKTIFLKLEDFIMNSLPSQTLTYKGEFMMELFQKGAHINHGNYELFLAEVRKLTDVFLQMGNTKGTPRLEHFCQCVKRVFGEPSEARCFAKAQSYRVHVTQKEMQPGNNGGGKVIARSVSYWCFAPSEAMRELANLQVRSILVTSGTLSPLESYALELDLPFPHRLENPHIIPDDQIHVRVIGKGVSNKILSSAYDRRQNDEYYTELGNTIISLAKIIPGGMLIFFPSYGVMETCLEKWGGPSNGYKKQDKSSGTFFAARKRTPTGSARYSFPHAPHTFSSSKDTLTLWKRLLGVKAVVVEPKSTADLPDAINEFHKYLNLAKSKGVALFGVCRGKISEGIDFAHDMCRAVVITGLPFAPSFDPKVKMKREFLDQNRSTQNLRASVDGGFDAKGSPKNLCLSGHEWYTQQAHRAVNQAIGRVIRNKNDYGAVLLLDNRFGLPANQKGLSKWVRPHILPDEGMGRTIGNLSRFYKEAAKKSEERDVRAAMPPPTADNPVKMILGYEKENQETDGNEDRKQVNSIAYVGESQTGDGDDALLSNSCYIRQDQVIQRVKIDERDKSKMQASASSSIDERDKSKMQASASSSIDNTTAKPVKVTYHEAPSLSKTSFSTLSPAQMFFKKVQEQFSPEQQSKMKHAAVAMRPSKDGKFGPKFNKAAQEMARLVLSYENFNNRSREDKPEMLMLLMQLLPPSKVEFMQQVSISIAFNDSTLCHLLRDNMTRENFIRCRSELVALLLRCWFKQSHGRYISTHDFLSVLETTFVEARSRGPALAEDQLKGLCSLLPSELRSSTLALIEQLEASRKIARLKVKEKTSIGESSVQLGRFRSASNKVPHPQEVSTYSQAGLGEETPLASGDTKEAACKRSNPEGSSSNRSAKSLKVNPSLANSKPGPSSSLLAQPQTGDGSLYSYRKAMEDFESEVFTGELRTTTMEIDSNAPKEMKCQLCEESCRKPILAQCNHIACHGCWSQWLKKSQTCPLCRRSTGWDSLALLVFK